MRGLAAKTGQEIGVNVAQKAMEKLRRRLGKGYDNSYSEDQAKGYDKSYGENSGRCCVATLPVYNHHTTSWAGCQYPKLSYSVFLVPNIP